MARGSAIYAIEPVRAPAVAAMLHLKAFVKKTAGGQIHRVVKEHYVRDDIECVQFNFGGAIVPRETISCCTRLGHCRSGSELDPSCKPENAKLSAGADHYLIVDTNIVLHQTDFLEHSAITDVIILSTVYQEVHHKNSSVFLRLKNLLRNEAKRFYYFSNEHHKVCVVHISMRPGSVPPHLPIPATWSCGPGLRNLPQHTQLPGHGRKLLM